MVDTIDHPLRAAEQRRRTLTHQRNIPGVQPSATGDKDHDLQDWIKKNLRRETTARNFINALLACDPEDRLDFLEGAYEVLRAGLPRVLFGSVMDQAAFWADRASRLERKAYALVCYERLSPQDQDAFRNHVQRQATG